MRCAPPATIPGYSRSGITKPAPGKRTTASASTICCCRLRPPTSSATPASTATCGPGKSRQIMCRCGSIWISKRNRDFVGWVERSETHRQADAIDDGFRFALPILQGQLIPSALQPVFQIDQRHGALVVAGVLEVGVVERLDPAFVVAGAVLAERDFGTAMALGRGQEEPARRLMRIARLAAEVKPAQLILRVGVAEIGGGIIEHF